jgi:hypothetical protein
MIYLIAVYFLISLSSGKFCPLMWGDVTKIRYLMLVVPVVIINGLKRYEKSN